MRTFASSALGLLLATLHPMAQADINGNKRAAPSLNSMSSGEALMNLFSGMQVNVGPLNLTKSHPTTDLIVGTPHCIHFEMQNSSPQKLMDVEVSDATFLAANMTLLDDFQFPFRRTEMHPDEKVSWDICVIPQATGRFLDFPVMMRYKVDGGESAGISLDEAGYMNAVAPHKGQLRVYTFEEYHSVVASHKLEWTAFMLSFAVILTLAVWRYHQLKEQLSQKFNITAARSQLNSLEHDLSKNSNSSSSKGKQRRR